MFYCLTKIHPQSLHNTGFCPSGLTLTLYYSWAYVRHVLVHIATVLQIFGDICDNSHTFGQKPLPLPLLHTASAEESSGQAQYTGEFGGKIPSIFLSSIHTLFILPFFPRIGSNYTATSFMVLVELKLAFAFFPFLPRFYKALRSMPRLFAQLPLFRVCDDLLPPYSFLIY